MQQWARLVACSLASLALPVAAHAAPLYSLRVIEPPEAGTETQGMSLNDRGEVAGVLYRPNLPGGAFFWDGTGPARELPPTYGQGIAINNRGEVVGNSNDGPFLWSAAGGTRILPAPEGFNDFAPEDVNDAGTIIGRSSRGTGKATEGGLVRRLADGTVGFAAGFYPHRWPSDSMNQRGAVAGAVTMGQPFTGGAIWEPDGTLRPVPDANVSVINDDGWYAGSYHGEDDPGLALWSPEGRRVHVPYVPGAEVSSQIINGINNRRELVGYLNHTNHDDDAFYWSEATGTIDLQNFLDESGRGWDLQLAVDINESGQILAWAWRGQKGGGRVGVLLTPVPEPSALLGVGIALILLSNRRPRRSRG
ncbi:MAG TPA: PEP-CTERM sorting domain-containing protein [Tepidisphaeraceae bacterium]|nr:PEP-CTERM sorting domain-containing protein [Tepidisphaeraceae bacterium]